MDGYTIGETSNLRKRYIDLSKDVERVRDRLEDFQEDAFQRLCHLEEVVDNLSRRLAADEIKNKRSRDRCHQVDNGFSNLSNNIGDLEERLEDLENQESEKGPSGGVVGEYVGSDGNYYRPMDIPDLLKTIQEKERDIQKLADQYSQLQAERDKLYQKMKNLMRELMDKDQSTEGEVVSPEFNLDGIYHPSDTQVRLKFAGIKDFGVGDKVLVQKKRG